MNTAKNTLAKRAPRQLSPQREQELMDAAREVFFAQGVSAATMDDIARLAGVSKATIYRRYSNKEEMFEAVIMASIKQLAEKFEALELNVDHPTDCLRKATKKIRTITTAVDNTKIMRQVIAEATKQPDLSRKVRDLMTKAVTKNLTDYFKKLIKAGLMQHSYPQQAAITFMLISSGGYRPLLNAMGTEKDEKKRLQADLTMFLEGCKLCDPEQ